MSNAPIVNLKTKEKAIVNSENRRKHFQKKESLQDQIMKEAARIQSTDSDSVEKRGDLTNKSVESNSLDSISNKLRITE
jgi:hypothetical protein